MLMHDEPFPALLFENHRPTEGAHVNFPVLVRHLFLYGGGAPDIVASRMQLGEHLGDSLLVFVPARILEWRDIEKRMRPRRVELRNVGWVERTPAVPDLLQISFIGSRWRCLLLAGFI